MYFCQMLRTLSVGLFFLFGVQLAVSQGDVEKLPGNINSPIYDETSPVVSGDDRFLFFTRTGYPEFDRTLIGEDGQKIEYRDEADFMNKLGAIYKELSGKEISDPVHSTFNQDIWYIPISNDLNVKPVHPGYPMNSALPNSLLSRGKESNEYIILNQFYTDGSMYAGFSRIKWEEGTEVPFPEPIHIYNFNVVSSDVNLTMSPDGDIVVLSMKGHDTHGMNDLYVSYFIRKDVYSTPVNIGSAINTAYQETTPFLSPDKRFLYFSSDRPNGAGGNDIYVSERLDYTWMKWTSPMLLSGNVNTKADESQPYFDADGNFMYFVSKRDGSSDLFRQFLLPKPKLKKPIVVRGKIIGGDSGKPVHGEIFWGPKSGDSYLEYFNSYTGEFEIKLTDYEEYQFETRKPGFGKEQITLDPAEIERSGKDTVELIIEIKPRKDRFASTGNAGVPDKPDAEKRLSFYNIQFVQSQPVILGSSYPALEDLALKLKRSPGLQILIEGHTDNVGDQGALLELSIARADAVKQHLVNAGVDPSRVQVVGMGDKKPLYDNSTEQGRTGNRRVEIKIIGQ